MFARTLGDTSDVVTKEMYTFADRGGDSLTLRPEGTAGVCRALVTNGLTQSLPQKVFYAGPMFRYERPQKGRYRQFHQIGAELIGAAEPLADAEVIACGWDILRGARRRRTTSCWSSTRWATPRAATPIARRWSAISPRIATRCPRTAGRGWSAIRCASSTARTSGDRALVADAPTIDGASHAGGRATFYDAAAGAPRPVRRAVPREPAHRARPRLLQPHRLRVRHRPRSARRARCWPAAAMTGWSPRWAARRRPAVGWAAGIERLAMLLAAAARAARADRRDPDGRGGRGSARIGAAAGAAPCRACAPRWPIAATSSAAWSAPTASAPRRGDPRRGRARARRRAGEGSRERRAGGGAACRSSSPGWA